MRWQVILFGRFTTGDTTDTVAPTVSSTNPVDTSTGVGIDASINATFDKAMDPATLNPVTFTVTGPGATVVAGQVTYDVPDMIVTFTPTSPLAASTTFTAALTGALDLAGNPLATFVWTFQTGTSRYRSVADRLRRSYQFRGLRPGHCHKCRCNDSQRRPWFDAAGVSVTGFPPGRRERDNPA